MATLVLSIAGTAAGAAIGGPIGAKIGGAVGAVVGGLIDQKLLAPLAESSGQTSVQNSQFAHWFSLPAATTGK